MATVYWLRPMAAVNRLRLLGRCELVAADGRCVTGPIGVTEVTIWITDSGNGARGR